MFRMNIKILHAALHTATLGIIGFGLYEVWEYHSSKSIEHLVSLHSQIGALTVGLFCAQYLMGLMSFIGLLACENVTDTARADFIPIHAAVGRMIFLLAIASCITGISQKIFTLDAKTRDDKLSLASTCAGAVIALGIVSMYILTTERLRYKAHILSNTSEE
ncbi:cytochrome b ascorbate-dependent protein 3-like [Photinus pyralis]|nr:cytochrome b ascorbate-dependent protein 3-like [Photinus pyralis]